MFGKIKSLWQRLDAYLRNAPLREAGELIPVNEDFWDDFDSRRDPWRTKAYWAVYRFFARAKIFHPRAIYYDIKYFAQRGRRGWADCDTWSLDYYLDGWLPDALRHLKKTKHGTPMGMFPTEPEYIDETGNPTEAAHEIAIARWDATMDKMIAAFEANRRIDDGLYEEELGPWPFRRPEGVSKEAWRKTKNDRLAAERLLQERDEKIFQEGMKLFVENYRSLWD